MRQNFNAVSTLLKRNQYEVIFHERENQQYRLGYQQKKTFLAAIKTGNLNTVRQYLAQYSINDLPLLLSDEVENLKLHMNIAIYYMADSAIEGGVFETVSYSMRSTYLKTVQELYTMDTLLLVFYHAAAEFTKKVEHINRYKHISVPVLSCMDYISKHLHEKISIAQLTDQTKLSPRQLARHFKMELGCTCTDYIQSERIEEAKLMLCFSSYSIVEIANYLSFCSESYFIHIFKKYTGTSPAQYRLKNTTA